MMPGDPKPIGEGRVGRFLMQVLWPSFLTAVVAVGVLFSLIDPQELVLLGVSVADTREAAYTVGFLLLWILFALSSSLTWMLSSGSGRPTAER